MGNYLGSIEYPPWLASVNCVVNHERLGPEQFREAVDMVQTRGGLTLVHCKMGEQRSATVAAGLMNVLGGISIKNAVQCSALNLCVLGVWAGR